MPTLLDALVEALSKHPGQHRYTVQVLRSAPRRSYSLFPHALNHASTKIWQEEVLVQLSEQVSHDSQAATKHVLPIVALEANVYTIPSTSTSLIYVSKVDTSGLSPSTPSPARTLVSAFLTHSLAHPPHGTKRVRIHVFARAQGQYLFPGSVDNKGKKVLDDKGLLKWWKATISKAVEGTQGDQELYYDIAGLTELEALPYVPTLSPSPKWHYGHPYSTLSSPLHLPFPSTSSDAPSPAVQWHDHIPNFPDDPKGRFLTSLTSSTLPPAGSENDYDETISSLSSRALSSTSSASSISTQLLTLEKDRDIERTRLNDGVPGGVNEYWERLAFRQECCSGALVGFFVVVKDGEFGEGAVQSTAKAPRPERMAVDHNVFTRLWSQFHNVDYGLGELAEEKEGRAEKIAAAAKKWEEDVERVVRAEGADHLGGGGRKEGESEEEFAQRKKEVYDLEVRREIVVDNAVLETGKRKIEEKVVNVMMPRKKKKV